MSSRLTLLILLVAMGICINPSRWMEELPDDSDFSTILYPGTHDSGTYNLTPSNNDFSWASKCQDLSIREQLAIGIRYVDIRVKYCNDPNMPPPDDRLPGIWNRRLQSVNFSDAKYALCIYHGSAYANLNFGDIQN